MNDIPTGVLGAPEIVDRTTFQAELDAFDQLSAEAGTAPAGLPDEAVPG